MRTNLPLSQHEYRFPSGETLMSTTDTASHIADPNAALVRSGYRVDELVGERHNLVRHPDTPLDVCATSTSFCSTWTAR